MDFWISSLLGLVNHIALFSVLVDYLKYVS